jgi:DNA-binding beta-propeller fold protein YncE
LGGAEAQHVRKSMTLLVTSAAGANGAGYGKILAFADDGKLIDVFGSDPRIADPRGLAIEPVDRLLFVNSGSNRILALDRNGEIVRASEAMEGLNPGGGNFGPDGRYYVGLRGERTIMAFARELDRAGETILPPQVVPFPRGFAFGHDGRLFLASGIGPGGEGDNTILAFDSDHRMLPSWKVTGPELSPLDLAIAPSGNIVVSSEHPFGAGNAVTTIREYDHAHGRLVRVLVPKYGVRFRKPRGLRFGPHARLYCVAQDEVVAFDFGTGDCLGAVTRLPHLNGQAVIFFP